MAPNSVCRRRQRNENWFSIWARMPAIDHLRFTFCTINYRRLCWTIARSARFVHLVARCVPLIYYVERINRLSHIESYYFYIYGGVYFLDKSKTGYVVVVTVVAVHFVRSSNCCYLRRCWCCCCCCFCCFNHYHFVVIIIIVIIDIAIIDSWLSPFHFNDIDINANCVLFYA